MRIYLDENFSPHLIKALAALQEKRKSEDVQVLSIAEDAARCTCSLPFEA